MIQGTIEQLIKHCARILRAYLLAYLSSTSPKVVGLLIALVQRDGQISKASDDVSVDILNNRLAKDPRIDSSLYVRNMPLACNMLSVDADSCCARCAEHSSSIDFLLSVQSLWVDL